MVKKLLFPGLMLLCGLWASAQSAPNFTITDTEGQVHRLYEDYLDQGKVVMLELMFVTCPPCNEIAEEVEAKYQAWGGGAGEVQFISLSIKPNDFNVNVASYENNHGLTFPGAGADGGAQEAMTPYKNGTFGLFWGTPTFVVIAPDRSVNYRVEFEDLDAAIEEALADPSYELTVSGLVRDIDQEPMSGSIVSAPDYGVADTVDAFGFYTLHLSGSGSAPDSVLLALSHVPVPASAQVSTIDLITIQKHLLNSQKFTHPLQYRAADVSGDKHITASDLITLRKLILDKIQSFDPSLEPFYYLIEDYILANPEDPNSLSSPLGEGWVPIGDNLQGTLNFSGIKLGDLR